MARKRNIEGSKEVQISLNKLTYPSEISYQTKILDNNTKQLEVFIGVSFSLLREFKRIIKDLNSFSTEDYIKSIYNQAINSTVSTPDTITTDTTNPPHENEQKVLITRLFSFLGISVVLYDILSLIVSFEISLDEESKAELEAYITLNIDYDLTVKGKKLLQEG